MDASLTTDIQKQVRQVEIKTRRLVDDSLSGQYHSVFKGRGMNFDEVREYVPGDDVRTIDWNVTARSGKTHVKKFTEERELTILLVMDVSASGEYGSGDQSKRRYMAELAAVLAFSAVKNSDKVGLVLFSEFAELYIPPQKGRRHILRVVREILFFDPKKPGTNIPAVLDFASQVTKRRAIVFLVTDFCLAGDYKAELSRLKKKLTAFGKRHDLVAVSITDPREAELPNVGFITIEDAETGEQVELDTGSKKVRDQYAKIAAQKKQDLERTIKNCGVDHLPLSTSQPFLGPLLGFFGRREKRRN